VVSVSFLLHYFLAPPEHFWQKKLSENSAPIPGGPCNLQGGVIYVEFGAVLEIYGSAFIGNTAYVSRFCSCYLAVL
jgi:hypothetical protein